MTGTLRRVAILGGSRIPFCRSNSLYGDLSNLEMMAAALNGLVDKYKLKGEHIDEVVGGAVVTHSKDFNIAREAVLSTKLATSTPGVTLIQACGTQLAGGDDVGRENRVRRNRKRHCGRVGYNVRRADRVLEKVFQALDRCWSGEDARSTSSRSSKG